MNLKNIILGKLYAIGAVKRGEFVLKSGKRSSIYLDMRVIISYPNIYRDLLDLLLQRDPTFLNEIDSVTGIHFGGLPFANYISFNRGLPQIYVRDSQKGYGTGKRIEGELKSRLLLVDDVLTTGGSINNVLHILDDYCVSPAKILVLVDRSEGEIPPFKYTALFTLEEILNFQPKFYENPVSNTLWNNALNKRSNIIFSADYSHKIDVLHAIDTVGPYVIGVKLHTDIINDFDDEFVVDLLKLREKHGLIIIEDRKLGDIGAIALKQAEKFVWADAVTLHPIVGESVIQALSNINVIPIVEMSSSGNLIDFKYTETALKMTKNKNVVGVVCQTKLRSPFDCLTMSPGIHLEKKADNLGQTYSNGSHSGLFWIVGRGISEGRILEDAAQEYQKAGWSHFKNY